MPNPAEELQQNPASTLSAIMPTKEFEIDGVRMTIIKKPAFEMAGFKKSVHLGDGSIQRFLAELSRNGKLEKLSRISAAPQQIWVCLSDCQSCGLSCTDFHACCRVCTEKPQLYDFSHFEEDELYVFSLPESEWVLYETKDKPSAARLHSVGVYEFVKQIGYQWNENIRLHFDNEHECYDNGEWIDGKTYRFLLPVVPFHITPEA